MATTPADAALTAEASLRVVDYYRHRADLGMELAQIRGLLTEIPPLPKTSARR